MRKLLVTCLIALLADAVPAQTTPRTSTQSPPSATNQRNNTATPPTKSRMPQSTDTKSSKTNAAPKTDASNNTASRTASPATQSRASQTQNNAGTSRNITPRQSAASPNAGTTTARSVANNAKKAPDVKAVNPVKVKWMTLEEALEKSKTDKRKIFVDVYTDWCGWCKRMDSTTFVNPAVAKYLNDHFYPVKFNAEQQKEIVFKDKTYQFKKNGARGHHELAAEWLNNRLSYPTVVFLDESQGIIQPLPGFQDATKMEAVLNYFGTDSHKKTPWETYQKKFSSAQKE